MNKNIVCLLLFALLFSSCSIGQQLTSKESGSLQRILYTYFKGPTWEEKPGSDEAFLCLVRIDNTGKAVAVRFLSGKLNAGPAFDIFNKMSLHSFEQWQSEKCKNKTIIIPIALVTKNKTLNNVYEEAGIDHFNPGETKDIVIIRGVDFSWPMPPKF